MAIVVEDFRGELLLDLAFEPFPFPSLLAFERVGIAIGSSAEIGADTAEDEVRRLVPSLIRRIGFALPAESQLIDERHILRGEGSPIVTGGVLETRHELVRRHSPGTRQRAPGVLGRNG